jgi:DNA-binding response OmpR family regulator
MLRPCHVHVMDDTRPLGADDYVTKPFSPREVAARVRAIVRRQRVRGGSVQLESHNRGRRKRRDCDRDFRQIGLALGPQLY